jgi:hypothetical protein
LPDTGEKNESKTGQYNDSVMMEVWYYILVGLGVRMNKWAFLAFLVSIMTHSTQNFAVGIMVALRNVYLNHYRTEALEMSRF